MTPRTLVFVPTYNERDNAPELLQRIEALGLDLDVMFLDDSSPDGTGEVLDRLASAREHMQVIHRPGKLGIGTAHQEGIRRAYAQGYERLITMDCDFTHPPEVIPQLLLTGNACDVAVGSRYAQPGSLRGWQLHRAVMTRLGHAVTKRLLGIPHDATGAFRLYDLQRVPLEVFDAVTSTGYSFFFESMFVLCRRGLAIRDVPYTAPPRAAGSSKMKLSDVLQSVRRAQQLCAIRLRGIPTRTAPKTPHEQS